MFTIAKGFAYKFCFCLGLGTATYYSYGQVQQWVHHDQVKVVENVVEKHVTRENTVYNDMYVPQEINYEQPAVAAPVAAVSEEAAVAAAPVVASTEEKKDDEKKEESTEKKDENSEEVAGGMIVPAQAPLMYAPQAGHAPASVSRAEEVNTTQDIPVSPNLMASAAPSSSTSGSSTSYSGGSASSFSGTLGALDSNDIAALIAPVKASFDDETTSANGLLCVDVSGRPDCARKNHVGIHSLRWSMNEGLKREAQFVIKSTGGTSLEFDLNFKIQNTAMAEENVSLTARPTEVLVHNELKDSKNYRVIEFKFADLNVRGETIKQVQVEMVYEITENGLVLNSVSNFSFSRNAVKVAVSKWEQDAQTNVFLIADELSFSMSIEKSL